MHLGARLTIDSVELRTTPQAGQRAGCLATEPKARSRPGARRSAKSRLRTLYRTSCWRCKRMTKCDVPELAKNGRVMHTSTRGPAIATVGNAHRAQKFPATMAIPQ